MSNDEMVSIDDCRVIDETPKAIRVEVNGKRHWVPKSLVQDDSEVWSLKNAGPGTLVVPEWFASKEGLG